MKHNWAKTRLFVNEVADCSMIIKLFSILLMLTALATGKAGSQLIDLNEDNWQVMLKGEWMVEFYAPWCPACKNLAPTWERYAEAAADFYVQVAKIDVTTSPSLSGRFFVTALPTIYHVKDGEFRQYRGSRDSDALLFFVKQKQWQKIDPISAWKKPNTIHMSILSYFFKLSHALKDLNTHLQDVYGLPTWGSYALFAFGTIFVGAALGLLLVCVVDALYPPKKAPRKSFSETKEHVEKEGLEDLAQDEIEDENALDDDDDDDAEDDDDDSNVDTENENQQNNAEEDEDDEEKISVIDKQESDEKKKQSSENITNKDEKETNATSSPGEVRKRKLRKD